MGTAIAPSEPDPTSTLVRCPAVAVNVANPSVPATAETEWGAPSTGSSAAARPADVRPAVAEPSPATACSESAPTAEGVKLPDHRPAPFELSASDEPLTVAVTVTPAGEAHSPASTRTLTG
jgi:hypothetical protein